MNGKPAVGELVIAQVNKIERFGAYCTLPEYNNMEVFLPLREVSSGWIKNIHEFIHGGQRLVCKVVYIDTKKNSIDVSLKKVTPKESKDKIGAYSLENRTAALFNRALKVSGLQPKKEQLGATVSEEFSSYTNLFYNATDNTQEFENSKLPKKLKETFAKLISANKKVRSFTVSYLLTVSTSDSVAGASALRKLFTTIADTGALAKYISAPKYRIVATGASYAEAEGEGKGSGTGAREILQRRVQARQREARQEGR